MKNAGKMTSVLLFLLLVGNGSLSAQYGMRSRMDTTRMNRPGRTMGMGNMQSMNFRNNSMRMNHMWMSNDSMRMNGMWMSGDSMPHRMMQRRMPMNNCDAMRMNMMRRMPEYGMRGRYMHHPGYSIGRGNFRGPMAMGQMRHDRFIDNIPNLTDVQKKEIADLHQNQMTEMNKLRQETLEKMKNLREANRSKMMNILTDDQKKWIESTSSDSKNNVTKDTKQK